MKGFDLEARGEDLYRHYIALALERAGGVQVKAAEMLGMSFRSFRALREEVQPSMIRSAAARAGSRRSPQPFLRRSQIRSSDIGGCAIACSRSPDGR